MPTTRCRRMRSVPPSASDCVRCTTDVADLSRWSARHNRKNSSTEKTNATQPGMSNAGAERDLAAARTRAPVSRSWRVVPGVFGLAGASVAVPAGGIGVDQVAHDPGGDAPAGQPQFADGSTIEPWPGGRRRSSA
jgi:hypothetical protein